MILVTAAGGKTGLHVIRSLRERGEPVRALGRSAAVHELRADGVETIQGDVLDVTTLRNALDGARAVVSIGPTFHPYEVTIGQAVALGAMAAGVNRLVQFSVYHPQLDFLVNHQAKLRIEDFVANSDLEYTILQPMHYMQNIDPKAAAAAGVLRLPYSMSTRLSFVDLVDVAEIAAKVLTEDGHGYATYPLCGSDFLSGDEVAAAVADASGSSVVGEEISVSAFLAMISADHELTRHAIDGFHRLFLYYGLHGIRGNANVLRGLLGREPTTIKQYVERSLAVAGDR
jgi:uncharacterized protein YbjT (DUF2867 family)